MLSFRKADRVRPMSKGDKEDEGAVPMWLRLVIAQNVDHYIPVELEARVAELGGFNPKTITRLRHPGSYPSHGVTVGSLVKISEGLKLASAINIEPWEWLRALRPGPALTGSETRISENQAVNATLKSVKKKKK
jgi:hypothetical protein